MNTKISEHSLPVCGIKSDINSIDSYFCSPPITWKETLDILFLKLNLVRICESFV